MEFVSHGHSDELLSLQQANFDLLVNECKKHKVRYIFIHPGEICGCEGISTAEGWPVMWTIAKNMGFYRMGGNSDQAQVDDTEGVFYTKDVYGAWDLKKMVKIDEDAKKFYRVVSRW